MRRMSPQVRAIPAEAAPADGLRLPREPATPKQVKALRDLIVKNKRLKVVSGLVSEGLPPETIAAVIGVKERTGYDLVGKARSLRNHPDVDLVLDSLVGMMNGSIAGVLGTRKTATSLWLFKLIAFNDPGELRRRHPLSESDHDTLRRFHAAFMLAYREWSQR